MTDKRWQRFRRSRSAPEATIRERIERKIEERVARGGHLADLRSKYKHVIEAFGHLRPDQLDSADVEAWVLWMVNDKKYSNGTVRTIYYLLVAIVEEATREGACAKNAAQIPRESIPKKRTRPGFDRAKEVPTVAELERILFDAGAPPEERMIAFLGYLGGLRFGEIAALTWAQYDPEAEPLGMLRIDRSHKHHSGRVGPPKTGVTRTVPVHPILAEALGAWRSSGWRELYGRGPEPDDLIIPHRFAIGARKGTLGFQCQPQSLKRFHGWLGALGLASRSLHSMRHAFVTLLRKAGADREAVRVITHTRQRDVEGDAFGVYDHSADFEAACRAVLLHPLGARRSPPPASPRTQEMPQGPVPSSGLRAESATRPAPRGRRFAEPRSTQAPTYPSRTILSLRRGLPYTSGLTSLANNSKRLTQKRQRPARHDLLWKKGRLHRFAPLPHRSGRRGFPPRPTVPSFHVHNRRGRRSRS